MEKVGNLNCVNGWDGPFREGEYSLYYGRAAELLKRFEREPFIIAGV
jgi:hypothetical protein